MADNTFVDKTRDWLKGRKDATVAAVGHGFDTLTGKAALEKVAEFVQETEAVNVALATRIYELLDCEAKLRERLLKLEADNRKYRHLVVVTFALHAIWLCVIGYLYMRGR
jgi:hypothetical protein